MDTPVCLISDVDPSNKVLKDQMGEEKTLNAEEGDLNTFYVEKEVSSFKREEMPVDFSENMNQFQEIKQDSPNKRKLTRFVSTIINNVKHAWVRAKSDYKESLRKRNKRLFVKKHPHPYLRQKKTITKTRRRTIVPKTCEEAISDKAVQEVISNASTFSTTFQSCSEWLPIDSSKIHELKVPLEAMDREDEKKSLEMQNMMNRELDALVMKSLDSETMYYTIEFLKKELEETKKRLDMFEKKYGLFTDLFVNSENHENSKIPASHFETEDHMIDDLTYPVSSLSRDVIMSTVNPHVLNSAESHEQVIDDDPSLEILSPVGERIICEECIQKIISHVEKNYMKISDKDNTQVSSNDPYRVKFNCNDPEHPYMWSSKKKIFHFIIIFMMTFIIFSSLTFYVPHVLIKPELHTNLFRLSIMLIGLALGSLIGSPLSKHYGHRKVFLVFFFAFTVAHLISVASQFRTLIMIVFRFLSGIFGGIIFSSCKLSIFDIFNDSKASLSEVLLQSSVLLGLHTGPIIGLMIEEYKETMWSFWIILATSCFIFILGTIVLKEASPEVILNKRINRLRWITGSSRFVACIEDRKPLNYIFLLLLKLFWNILSKDFVVLAVIISKTILLTTSFLILFVHPFSLKQTYQLEILHIYVLLFSRIIGLVLAICCYKIQFKIFAKRLNYGKIERKLFHPVVLYPVYIITLFWMAFTTKEFFHYLVPVLSHCVLSFSEILILDGFDQYVIASYPHESQASSISFSFPSPIVSVILHAVMKISLNKELFVFTIVTSIVNVFSYIIPFSIVFTFNLINNNIYSFIYFRRVLTGLFGTGVISGSLISFSYNYFSNKRHKEKPSSIELETKTCDYSESPVNPYGLYQYCEPKHTNDLLVRKGYISCYDRRMRVPFWVLLHITPTSLKLVNGNRKYSVFKEDPDIPEKFCSKLSDYYLSGYDRGHLAPAANIKFSQDALNETFYLTNIAPQIGEGFNRNYWSYFEEFCRSLTSKYSSIYLIIGPLYLPKKDLDGKWRVTYEMIGNPPNIAVPTHFFSIIYAEDETKKDSVAVGSFVFPNAKIDDNANLMDFIVPIDAIERASGIEFEYKSDKKQKELCKEVKCIVKKYFPKKHNILDSRKLIEVQ
ncbi:hypothetical protein PORY_002073 [Pneumocystis oryctolagi]|uniref:Uncharacterized protein n=1 Tax=Pneumocystis oryctolagi TaxID=42067 RepID=A0ACB7CBB0_9ASCO|nr:hypothetical protein PORY_002073 [Pneumocystis oryctolagi]